MPDTRSRRGAHPQDGDDFAPDALPLLRQATEELCWMLSRGYPKKASLKLVGDRHRLRARQRKALQRCAAGDEDRRRRSAARVAPEAIAGRPLLVDGYNVLLTVEAALGGGVLLKARDGTLRDMAAMSGHYRRVDQTVPALAEIGDLLRRHSCTSVRWLLDRPVSNSGRLKGIIMEVAEERGWSWQVELVPNPDPLLAESDEIIASADSAILDRCQRWLNLARLVVEERVPGAWVVDLA